jgi:heme/copper-type cytochrome/quinol oxidase subunit 4
MKGKKGRSSFLPYAAFAIRISFGIFAMAVAVLFFLEMTEKADERIAYALCYLIPVIAASIVGGDLYLRWRLDIRPLRAKKKSNKETIG